MTSAAHWCGFRTFLTSTLLRIGHDSPCPPSLAVNKCCNTPLLCKELRKKPPCGWATENALRNNNREQNRPTSPPCPQNLPESQEPESALQKICTAMSKPAALLHRYQCHQDRSQSCALVKLAETTSTLNSFCLLGFFSQFHYLLANKRISEECFVRCCTESLMLPSAGTLLEHRHFRVEQLLICVILPVDNAKRQHVVTQKTPVGEH